jgi:hypothetical protein
VDAAENDNASIIIRGNARKLQAVAGHMGQVLDFSGLIVMSQDQGILLFCQTPDFIFQFHYYLRAGIQRIKPTAGIPPLIAEDTIRCLKSEIM